MWENMKDIRNFKILQDNTFFLVSFKWQKHTKSYWGIQTSDFFSPNCPLELTFSYTNYGWHVQVSQDCSLIKIECLLRPNLWRICGRGSSPWIVDPGVEHEPFVKWSRFHAHFWTSKFAWNRKKKTKPSRNEGKIAEK